MTAVYPKLLRKISRRPITTHKISQGGATLLDCVTQNSFDRLGQRFISLERNAAGRARRVNACHKECFIGVDIAHPHDDLAIHDKLFNR